LPSIGKSWRANWSELIAFLKYPAEIRKALRTTNVIESVSSSLRKIRNNRGVFPIEESLLKLGFLALERIGKKWAADSQLVRSTQSVRHRTCRVDAQTRLSNMNQSQRLFDRQGCELEFAARAPARSSSQRMRERHKPKQNPLTQIS